MDKGENGYGEKRDRQIFLAGILCSLRFSCDERGCGQRYTVVLSYNNSIFFPDDRRRGKMRKQVYDHTRKYRQLSDLAGVNGDLSNRKVAVVFQTVRTVLAAIDTFGGAAGASAFLLSGSDQKESREAINNSRHKRQKHLIKPLPFIVR